MTPLSPVHTTPYKAAESQVVIVGGGLAGLTNAIHLSKKGVEVTLIEKNGYPKHKVCGEYISNEVLPYLAYLGVEPIAEGAADITRFELSTHTGKTIEASLPLGGFGISRYLLDDLLYRLAVSHGVQVVQDVVVDIHFEQQLDQFEVVCRSGSSYHAQIVIGAYGKRSNVDVALDRSFMKKKSPYLGVKGHYEGDFPADLVALHNFEGGYCGVSRVENGRINICYLASVGVFKQYGSIQEFEQMVVCKNPHLKRLWDDCTPVFDQPLTISQVSFLPKPTVEEHILMSGDSAGMIHPLCGNGMGMAIHSGLLLSEAVLSYLGSSARDRHMLEQNYRRSWQRTFRRRLTAGRVFNSLFGSDRVLELGLNTLTYVPRLLPVLIKQTHGRPLTVDGPP